MIVRGAVLREMGLPSPYSESRPLRIEEVELAPPGPGELLVRIQPPDFGRQRGLER